MRNWVLLICVLGAYVQLSTSCEKQENLLEGDVIYNPFEGGNGIELMAIDSIREWPGPNPLPNIKGYFHINYSYFEDTSEIYQVVLHRNGSQYALLTPGNQTFFVDIAASPGSMYEYQLSLIMNDGSRTKKTMPYLVDF